MNFNIVRNAIPMRKIGTGRKLRYPYDKLNIGDAIEFAGLTKTEQALRLRELKSVYAYGRKNNKIFSLRSSHDGIQLIRVA